HDHRWIAALDCDAIELPSHAHAGERVVGNEAETFPAEVVDQSQDAEATAVSERIHDEVERPALVRGLRDRHRRPRAQGALAAAAPAHGEPERCDEALLPDFHWQSEPGWAPIGGTLHFKAHYQLLLDNLLDLSHEAFLHANTIGNAAVADVPARTTNEGNHVRVTRLMQDCAPPPLFVKARGFTSNIDRLQDLLFTPPCYITITVRATPAGTNDLSQALQWQVLNALTPETDTTTHYFWGLPRQFLIEDREMDAMLEAAITRTFIEDQAMLEAQQVVTQERSLDERSLLTLADAGPTRARGVIARLMREENAEVRQ